MFTFGSFALITENFLSQGRFKFFSIHAPLHCSRSAKYSAYLKFFGRSNSPLGNFQPQNHFKYCFLDLSLTSLFGRVDIVRILTSLPALVEVRRKMCGRKIVLSAVKLSMSISQNSSILSTFKIVRHFYALGYFFNCKLN